MLDDEASSLQGSVAPMDSAYTSLSFCSFVVLAFILLISSFLKRFEENGVFQSLRSPFWFDYVALKKSLSFS